ncbi:(2,3-dihydroxybenzoyl)adenylate synthase [Rhizobium sp. SSA_523]|uniref:(2,3-dihydroxybenzoyl)adenylate synthase n=1 Tax=Rhizobium sp. SSA_523 TaxID=2952477 RepID=UPI0020915DC3|nr:AMP-binding protein [Rhizobium sp. SSA_523]MCO5732807.1 AMP-binding protein [Rhizobium sp. SSA_523]WKC23575.1 AMP-binding protein [Rhizobium sp. SSA_523]
MLELSQVWPAEDATRYRDKGYWRGETMYGFLEQRARDIPGHVAVMDGDQHWTYAELLRRADETAARFLSLGLHPGERVVVQLPNGPEFLSVVFGLFRANLIPVFALPAHRAVEISHFVAKSEASAYVIVARDGDFDYRMLAREVWAQSPGLRHVVVIGDAQEFDALDALPAGNIEFPPSPSPSSVAFLQISGGSTGLSKLIPRTHDDYIYSFRASADICGLSRDSVFMATLPVAHNFPMSSPGVFGALYAGSRIVMCPSPGAEMAFALIERHRVTITGVVPPLALLWMQAAATSKRDISSLEVLLVGGAKFAPEAASRVRATLGCALQQVFGMAEGLVNYTRLDDPEEIIVNTQGRPISPDDDLLIVDDHGNPVADGEAGHLLTRGPYTIRAYHNDEAANARAFTSDGYYRTGDIVSRTPEGNLVVRGRAGDHINRAGEKVSAEEIEGHLLAHPLVFDAAVVSIPDSYLGERSCAFVIPRGERPKAAALKAFVRGRGLADFKVPDQIVFVDAFETTAVGKISRMLLREQLRDRFLKTVP